MADPRTANGHRRRQVRKRVLSEEHDCWLCGKPVDRALKTPDPMSPEVDEVIPVSLGGSPFDRKNCRLAHRICNVRRGNSAGPSEGRRVVLISGPPGSGKSTHAHTLGLPVYDLDDERWHGSERLFRDALRVVAQDPNAQAAVIRCAATLDARGKAARMCGATEVVVVDTPLATCIERITSRGRQVPSIRAQIAAAKDWWSKYEPGEVSSAGEPRPVAPLATSRAW